jgi:ketosteroid isomerase-like protein
MTRRRIIGATLSILAFFAIAWRTARSATPPDDGRAEVMKLEEERNQALQTGDIATLERIYSDDLIYTNASGVLLTKQQHLAELKSRGLNFHTFKHEDVQVTMHGDAGFVTGVSKSVVEYRGSVSTGSRRFLNIFVKKDGRWQLVGHVEANIEEPKEK